MEPRRGLDFWRLFKLTLVGIIVYILAAILLLPAVTDP
jgi:uncharacterized membrane protein